MGGTGSIPGQGWGDSVEAWGGPGLLQGLPPLPPRISAVFPGLRVHCHPAAPFSVLESSFSRLVPHFWASISPADF